MVTVSTATGKVCLNRKRQDVRLYDNRNLAALPPESGAGLFKHIVPLANQFKMDNSSDKKDKRLNLRITGSEYDLLLKQWKETACRKLSDYLRKVIFNRAVVRLVRNKSLDDLMAEAVLLRKELNAIGSNFNQAVHRLHTLDHLPQMQAWLKDFERDKIMLFEKIDAVKSQIDKLASRWLQS